AGERATPSEVLGVFTPRWPQLVLPPPSEALVSSPPGLESFAPYTAEDRVESNFNHNVSGLLVLLIAGVAILHYTGCVSLARHWPLLFVGLAVFLFLHAESLIWPFGDVGPWEQLADPAAIQHRLATLVVTLFALLEWRVQAGSMGGSRWRFAFPILALIGSAILLTHTHTGLPTRDAFLIEVSHDMLGLLAAFIGAGRWLELRLPPPGGRLGGVLWRISLLGVGFVLLFYHE
ncbi:MAG TPA: copper resistance protein CopD, partial [Candidatus Methylomirabilis sp.]|nr:copper resistance protein CopD [Candidatus Methylomirabilis sp.]